MKIKQIILSAIALVLPIFTLVGNVSAGSNDSTITYQKIDGVYFYLQNKTTGAVDTNHVTKFFMNGQIAYCIEPMVDINDKTFNSTNSWNVTSLSSETRRYLELVGYYGYEYPSHRTDRYWLATQQLIWERVNSNVSVKFTTGANGSGSVINLSNEKNEILSLVNKYSTTPDFGSDTIEVNLGDEVTINDKNNVLNEYNLTYTGKHTITKNGNQLKIKLAENEITDEAIRFTRPSYDNKTTILYYQGNSQKLASLRISDPIRKTINLKVNGGTVEVDKKGEKVSLNNASYSYEVIQLPDVVFALYANEDIKDSAGNIIYRKYQFINTLTSNENGIATLENLYFGKYFIIEGESSLGNMVNKDRYEFEITKDDIVDGKIIKKLDFQNFLPKGTFEFTKTDVVTGKPIPNTTIQVFTEDDRLIFTGTTDQNGKIKIDNLFTGKFYIIEKNPASGYKITDEKIYFEVTENGEVVKASMTNEPIIEEKVVEVPDTAQNDYTYIVCYSFIAGGILFLISGIIFALYYEKKNKKQNK